MRKLKFKRLNNIVQCWRITDDSFFLRGRLQLINLILLVFSKFPTVISIYVSFLGQFKTTQSLTPTFPAPFPTFRSSGKIIHNRTSQMSFLIYFAKYGFKKVSILDFDTGIVFSHINEPWE